MFQLSPLRLQQAGPAWVAVMLWNGYEGPDRAAADTAYGSTSHAAPTVTRSSMPCRQQRDNALYQPP